MENFVEFSMATHNMHRDYSPVVEIKKKVMGRGATDRVGEKAQIRSHNNLILIHFRQMIQSSFILQKQL